MKNLIISLTITVAFFIGIVFSHAEDKQYKLIALSDSIGTEIDQTERASYHLFPDINGFQSARILQSGDANFRLEYSCQNEQGIIQHQVKKISATAVELTRLHIQLTNDYRKLATAKALSPQEEAALLYRLALKYASQADYEMTEKLLEDLIAEFPSSEYALKIQEAQLNLGQLVKNRKALFKKGALLEQGGRTNLLIFSGYYGVWLGIATPMALNASSEKAYAAGLLIGAPASVLLTHELTKSANMSVGRATMITLGGHLGTWQGLGWSGIADWEAEGVVGMGELAGLVGIGAAAYLTSQYDFSEGHAALTSAGLEWGAWFGFVFAMIADHKDDQVLRDMLIGSDLFVLTTGLTTRNVQMSNTRVRLINLAGVMGAVFGFGLNLLLEVDDTATAFGIAGLGSVGGAIIGKNLTRNFDRNKDLAYYFQDDCFPPYSARLKNTPLKITPQFAFSPHPGRIDRLIPTVGIQFDF